jgi:hypothetical protein
MIPLLGILYKKNLAYVIKINVQSMEVIPFGKGMLIKAPTYINNWISFWFVRDLLF